MARLFGSVCLKGSDPVKKTEICNTVLIFFVSRCLTLILLGTRIVPRPNPPDIIMDLAARAEQFQEGVAHEGMATGTR